MFASDIDVVVVTPIPGRGRCLDCNSRELECWRHAMKKCGACGSKRVGRKNSTIHRHKVRVHQDLRKGQMWPAGYKRTVSPEELQELMKERGLRLVA